MNLYKMLLMALAIISCINDLSAMRRAYSLPVQNSRKKNIQIISLEEENKKIIVPLNIAQQSTAINSLIEDFGGEKKVILSNKPIPLEASVSVIQNAFDMLAFPASLEEKIKKYSLSELIDMAQFLHKYDFPQKIVDSFKIRIEQKQRENIPSIASRITKEPWRIEKAKESHKLLLKSQSPAIKISGLEGQDQIIVVPLNVLGQSTIINSMINDIGSATEVSEKNMVIPLNASLEVIKDIFHTLTFPDSLQEKLKKYSLKELIDRFNFLHQYSFSGKIIQLFEEKIRLYNITSLEEEKTIEQLLNRDTKKELFISHAIEDLKSLIIKKHINDEDRKKPILLNGFISSIAFSPDGKKMISGGSSDLLLGQGNKNLLSWTINGDGNINENPQSFSDLELPAMRSVAFSPDGKKIASASAGGYERNDFSDLLLWTVKDDNIDPVPQVLKGHTGTVDVVVFHPTNHKIMISGSWDEENGLRLWTFNNDDSITSQVLEGNSRYIMGIVFSSNGEIMISASRGKKNNLLLWTFNIDGSINTTPQVLENDFDSVDSIAFSLDGKKLISAHGGTIVLWDLSDINNITKKIIKRIEGWAISKLAFSHDNKKFILQGGFTSYDPQIFLCDINNPEIYQIINCPERGGALIFSPDDKKIIEGFKNKLLIWNLFKPQEEQMLQVLTQTLTVAQARLISRLSRLMQHEKKITLSSFDAQIYIDLPLKIRELLKDNVFTEFENIKLLKLAGIKKKFYERFDEPQYENKYVLQKAIETLKKMYNTARPEITQLYGQALDEIAKEMEKAIIARNIDEMKPEQRERAAQSSLKKSDIWHRILDFGGSMYRNVQAWIQKMTIKREAMPEETKPASKEKSLPGEETKLSLEGERSTPEEKQYLQQLTDEELNLLGGRFSEEDLYKQAQLEKAKEDMRRYFRQPRLQDQEGFEDFDAIKKTVDALKPIYQPGTLDYEAFHAVVKEMGLE